MARLSEQEKQELLEDAHSSKRRREFAALRNQTEEIRLSPEDYIQFLNEAQPFMLEKATPRKLKWTPKTGQVA